MDYFKKDYYLREFTGSEYYLRDIKTIGDLKTVLARIIEDLPDDDSLRIAEIDAFRRPYPTLEYILKDPIPFPED